MANISIKNDAGLMTLAVRLVIGWTYFSAFWRRTILVDKLDPETAGYIGEKFNHFLPNALGIKPIIQYLVENPDILWINMVLFTIIEGIVGLFIIFGLFTRIMSVGVFSLAMGILLGSGWIGTTCLDEWQIGVLGIATGFVLFLTGSGRYSLDNYMLKNNFSITTKKWFAWVGSGTLPIKESVFPKFVLGGSIFILGMTLMTNQVFHGGLWGPLHNKSVKPVLEITEGRIDNSTLSFDVFRTEGVDVYGSWVINIELLDGQGDAVVQYNQADLASLPEESISNYYVSEIKSGKHSLIVPLGAKATLNLHDDNLSGLSMGSYLLKITDISGAFWEHEIEIK
ncbi:TQO small subunit DoxD [Marinilabilia salmonicolor]|jgi:thiosulfate dehydrogenase [quinone] large subunit|uniref:Thiosulfate dehydrogenase [quinone] large subunit n=1 Tax=Marinilabilia salmonicolor TaxID=989 RepID=A0A2T0WYX0_9BACT|nr:TQO small subunit DoxD [Marinilabilia salmonicolor]PRY91867.1 thiosulfate dehydrogenase [quinone] large subunit [Marinilabilia salmonicolor]RCW34601.1 thiosulfate dehydrogenase [quinone] large subunit [Marinilabilia salmonicolor]